MKQFLFSSLLFMFAHISSAQTFLAEKVEWINPKVYKAKSFTFKTDSINFVATNSRILEIKSTSGVTGYYLKGDASIQIVTKNLNETCTAAMFRFNPREVDSLISSENMKEITDDDFVSESLKVLKLTFRHCYHKNMDALIPDPGAYAVNFFSKKIGEVLVSKAENEMIYYNFTLKSKM